MKIIWIEDYTKEIPMQHCPEHLAEEGKWSEEQYNYRLNTCSDILVLVHQDEIIGHMGISDNTIRSVYIDEQFQGQGLSYKLYEFIFNFYETIYSDDAREPVANHIWKQLTKMYPNQISYDKQKDQYCWSKG